MKQNIKNVMIIGSIVASLGIATVSAGTVFRTDYNATIPKGQSGALDWVNAKYTTTYAVNNVNSSSGNAAIHSRYETQFNGKVYTIGKSLKQEGNGYRSSVYWKPSKISSAPVTDQPSVASATCSGNNTTEYKCAVAGSNYRLTLSNENWFNGYTISGNFTLRD